MSNAGKVEAKEELLKKAERITGFGKGSLNYWIVEEIAKKWLSELEVK